MAKGECPVRDSSGNPFLRPSVSNWNTKYRQKRLQRIARPEVRGAPHNHGGGRHYVLAYDFKGLPVTAYQQLVDDYKFVEPDWATPILPTLMSTPFETTAVMDALGRPVTMTDAGGNITRHEYDKGGALKAVYLTQSGSITETTYVQDIHYDAKGQRQAIWYGNGTKTKYQYDPLTYRLTRLLTINLNTSPHKIVQKLKYWYDAVGNITQITDSARPTVFYDNTVIRPEQTYTYDALYRLIEATGREMIGDTTTGHEDNSNDSVLMNMAASPFDGNALQNYTQSYEYDPVGNITRLVHNTSGTGSTGSYTRVFNYDTGTSNQLISADVVTGSSTTYTYGHDTRGNMKAMPHLTDMQWNSLNQLKYLTTGTVDAYYQYSGGQRLRKVVEKAGDITEERIYLGSYELYRKRRGGTIDVERSTVHIADDTGRIAMLEIRSIGRSTDDNDTPAVLTRYIYSNHLQSSGLELDETGNVISYEEYHPYGTTSYQAMDSTIKATAKRYRFTGKERDEESGLNYHGARYYAPWLYRWVSVDPLEGKFAGMSPYNYGFNNPISYNDPTGMKGNKPGDTEERLKVDNSPSAVGYTTTGGNGSPKDNFQIQEFTYNTSATTANKAKSFAIGLAKGIVVGAAAGFIIAGLIASGGGLAILGYVATAYGMYKTGETVTEVVTGKEYGTNRVLSSTELYDRAGQVIGGAIGGGIGARAGVNYPVVLPQISTPSVISTPSAPPAMSAPKPVVETTVENPVPTQELAANSNVRTTVIEPSKNVVAYEQEQAMQTKISNSNELISLQAQFEQLANEKLLPKYLEIDPNLKSGYTGSFKTGVVGNSTKATYGEPINLSSYDIDFWIESNILFDKFGKKLTPDPEFRQILQQTPGFEGLRPNSKGFTIKFKPASK